METTNADRDIVKQVIERCAKLVPSHGESRLDTVFNDRFYIGNFPYFSRVAPKVKAI